MREGQAFSVAKLLLVIGHASAQLLQKGCHSYLGSADCAWRALWIFIHAPDRKETQPNPWEQVSTQMVFLHWGDSVVVSLLDTVKALGKNKNFDLMLSFIYINSSSPTRNQLQTSTEGFFQVTHDTGSETPEI